VINQVTTRLQSSDYVTYSPPTKERKNSVYAAQVSFLHIAFCALKWEGGLMLGIESFALWGSFNAVSHQLVAHCEVCHHPLFWSLFSFSFSVWFLILTVTVGKLHCEWQMSRDKFWSIMMSVSIFQHIAGPNSIWKPCLKTTHNLEKAEYIDDTLETTDSKETEYLSPNLKTTQQIRKTPSMSLPCSKLPHHIRKDVGAFETIASLITCSCSFEKRK